MCRWLSYSGDPVPLERMIVTPEHSLLDQSMSAKMAAHPTNADGIGVGWYGANNEPGVYHSVLPAWNDQNLKELAHHIQSNLFMAHIRHSTGTPVQQTNCHPFRYANWMFVHNGLIRGLEAIRRDLIVAIDPKYFKSIRGNTDSEIIFYLALTFGLQNDVKGAVEKAVGLVEKLGKAAGIEFPVQATFGITDSERLYAFRYSTEGDSRSLFYSNSAEEIYQIYRREDFAAEISDNARAVVSEPVRDLPGVWTEVPESSMLIVENGQIETAGFTPCAP